jgi:hypothetical protein
MTKGCTVDGIQGQGEEEKRDRAYRSADQISETRALKPSGIHVHLLTAVASFTPKTKPESK